MKEGTKSDETLRQTQRQRERRKEKDRGGRTRAVENAARTVGIAFLLGSKTGRAEFAISAVRITRAAPFFHYGDRGRGNR